MRQIWVTLFAFGLILSDVTQAHQQSWPGKRLAEMNSQAKNFSKKQVTLNPTQITWIETNLKEPIKAEDKTPVFYIATDENKKTLGYIIFLDADGTNGKIELGMTSSPDGTILNTVLFEHSESKTLESRSFLSQFDGKRAADKFKVGVDVTVSQGNERPAQAIANSVRRGLLMAMAGLGLGGKPQGK